MKYRVLNTEEMEIYKIGYKVGAREMFITGQEWASEEEHQIYRKGYNAGCKDRQRKNLKPELLDKCQQCQQCQQCPICDSQDSQDSQDSVYHTDTDIDTDILDNNILNNNLGNIESNKGVIGGKEREIDRPPLLQEVILYSKDMDAMQGAGGFKCSQETAEQFWSYYQAQNWRIGNEFGTPIKDWQAKLRNWAMNPKTIEQERKKPQKKWKM